MVKLLSGRFVATVGVVLAYFYAVSRGMVDPQAIVAITLIVIKDYFERKDRKRENNV